MIYERTVRKPARGNLERWCQAVLCCGGNTRQNLLFYNDLKKITKKISPYQKNLVHLFSQFKTNY